MFSRHVSALKYLQEVRKPSLCVHISFQCLLLQGLLNFLENLLITSYPVCLLLSLCLPPLLLPPAVSLCSGLSVLLQHDLVPGLDKVDMLSAGVVSCKMTQRGSTLADAVLPCILTQLICVLRYSGSSTGYLPPKGHKKGPCYVECIA